jgi:hypothetical protein
MMTLIAHLNSIFGKIGGYVRCLKKLTSPSSIRDAPNILGRCLDGLHAGSGWTYLVVMGGPHPLSNGDIAVARFDAPYVVLVLLLTYLQLPCRARRCRFWPSVS